MPEFEKVVIFGTGLIGGSFALGLKEAGAVEEVVGFGRTPATLRKAQELGVIDRAGINPAHEIGDADIVLVATPVAQMPEIFERIAPYLGPNTIVTDGGSTKGDVVAAARAAFKGHIGKFVPAHPIAGAEDDDFLEFRHGLGASSLSASLHATRRQCDQSPSHKAFRVRDQNHSAIPGSAIHPV